MKTFCALATLAAATAVENTAPVISLSLDSAALTGTECGAAGVRTSGVSHGQAQGRTGCIHYDDHVAAHGVTSFPDADGTAGAVAANTYSSSHTGSFAAKGFVGASESVFAEPTASAYDHHDASNVEIIKTYTYFVVSRPACNTFDKTSGVDSETLAAPDTPTTSNNALSAGTEVNNGQFKTDWTEEQCVMNQVAANVDLVKDLAQDDNEFTTQMRARRGEFIIKYDATDRAGNKASQLVFAMIMIDNECPCIVSYGSTGQEELIDVEAMDSCAAVFPFKTGGKTGTNSADANELTSCDTLDRNEIVLNEQIVYWKDTYDGFSPTMASAGQAMRSHGLSYTVKNDAHAGIASSQIDDKQVVYNMDEAGAVSGAHGGISTNATVTYTTKDYANIFGHDYADNQCTNNKHDTHGARHCSHLLGNPDLEWSIRDTLAPRVFANPNLEQNGAETELAGVEDVTAGCGAEIVDFTILNTGLDGRTACHSWNLRRRWCSSESDDECVGWEGNKLFKSGTGNDCTKEVVTAIHECGTAYEEAGYVCIDMRDSFTTSSTTGEYQMTIAGVNDGTGCVTDTTTPYHVKTDCKDMHRGIIYSQGDDITSDDIVMGPAGNTLPLPVDATGYPLYGKNGACTTDFTATYTCMDRMTHVSTRSRTVTIKDTQPPNLQIATAGMNTINKQQLTYAVGVNTTGVHAHGLYKVGNTSFTDSTHMDDKDFTGGRRDVQSDSSYVNNKGLMTPGDWHGDHTSAATYKNMNSHYHDKQNSNYDSEISDGTVGEASREEDFAGKTWMLEVNYNQNGVQDSYVIQHSSGFDADEAVITNLVKAHKGFACFDACDGDLTHAMTSATDAVGDYTGATDIGATNGVTMTWHEHTCNGEALATGFNTLVPGTYVLKYVCKDQCGNNATKCRTILNEDHTKPVITVLEADEQVYEATRNDNYVDAGATCSDEVDGNISQDVEVSGDVVNLARVGVYTIKYNCQDSASNEADEATRTVTVQDTSCPSCIVSDGHSSGLAHITSIEASFPYGDAGAVAQDTLQGSFGICSVWGHEERGSTGYEASYGMKASYKNIVNVERTGTYVITYRVKDSNGNWNDESSGCTGGQTLGENKRTVVIIDTLRPVIELKYRAGPQTVDSNGATTTPYQVIHRSAPEFKAGVDFSDPRGDGDVPARADNFHHTGAFHNNDANPAATGAPALMAEESATTAVNGWVIGAVASAVSGLALLGYSLRKSAAPVATSVPV